MVVLGSETSSTTTLSLRPRSFMKPEGSKYLIVICSPNTFAAICSAKDANVEYMDPLDPAQSNQDPEKGKDPTAVRVFFGGEQCLL